MTNKEIKHLLRKSATPEEVEMGRIHNNLNMQLAFFAYSWLRMYGIGEDSTGENTTPIQVESVRALALEKLRLCDPSLREQLLTSIIKTIKKYTKNRKPEAQNCIDALSNILDEV